MRVLIVSQYYPPEVGAPQTRLRETAARLIELGWHVRVITCQPHYPHGVIPDGYSAFGPRQEHMDGVEVFRFPTLARPNRGFVNRVIDQAAFAMVGATALGHARWADVLLVESPPLFLGLTARWLSAVARRPYVLHVADPWPDYPIELGVLRSRSAIAVARRLERVAYGGASAITTPTNGCKVLIEAQTSALGKVSVVPNGVDITRFTNLPTRTMARAQLDWDPQSFTFAYVGTVGLAQGLDTLIAAASILESSVDPAHRPAIRIIGDGQDVDRLKQVAAEQAPQTVQFMPPVSQDRVPTVLAAADAGLVLLRRGRLASAALPTKLVEALAAGLPVIVSADGEASEIVGGAAAGLTVPAEDDVALAGAMSRMAAMDDLSVMSNNGRQLAMTAFDRKIVVRQLADELESAARRHRPAH